MDVNKGFNISKNVFYKFLELYEEDALDETKIEMFKGTSLFCFVYNYIMAKTYLEKIIQECLEKEDDD